jgi:hypothetical protein
MGVVVLTGSQVVHVKLLVHVALLLDSCAWQ